jgi:hypothetical protein
LAGDDFTILVMLTSVSQKCRPASIDRLAMRNPPFTKDKEAGYAFG